jgi:hypothetical protein
VIAHHIAETITTTFLAGPPATPPTTVSSSGISTWLKDNVVQLLILVVGIGLIGKSRKGDTSGSMLTIGLLVGALAVVAVGVSSAGGVNVGKWVAGLFGISL